MSANLYGNIPDPPTLPVQPTRPGRGCCLLLLLGLGGLTLFGLATIAYFFSFRYDVPFRLEGHFEKSLYLQERPFAVSPDGTTIVYSSLLTGHGDLYQMDAEGKNPRRLTSDPEYEGGPSYSPDGKWIAFCRETHKCGHIWIMASDGTASRQITSGSDYDTNPRFTPDGSRIWFQRTPHGTSAGLYINYTMTADGKNIQALAPIASLYDSQAVYSPQTGQVYYTQGSDTPPYTQIWRMNENGAGKKKITDGANLNLSYREDRIAYVSGSGESELWLMKPDGSEQRRIYQSNSGKRFVCFTPDDRHLLFFEETSKEAFISRIDLNGSNYRHLYKYASSWN